MGHLVECAVIVLRAHYKRYYFANLVKFCGLSYIFAVFFLKTIGKDIKKMSQIMRQDLKY